MMTLQTERVAVVLIKPSSYDQAGYVSRYHRQVLPSNSLGIIHALTRRILIDILPADLPWQINLIDDGLRTDAKRMRRLFKSLPAAGTKIIVGLVAVQSSQIPRAREIIRQWQGAGATTIIGGAHVTGSLALWHDGVDDSRDLPCPQRMPEEIREMMDNNVVIFHGEADLDEQGQGAWRDALGEMIAGQPKPIYHGGKPDISWTAFPYFPDEYRHNFVSKVLTVDDSRGCPFACSFCCIINFQGRQVRSRSPRLIAEWTEGQCREHGSVQLFFTGDNLARNPKAEELLEYLARLRSQGCQIDFMAQADLACGKKKGFIQKLADAGCGQIFFGVESLNQENLAAVGKRQNNVPEYAELWRRCHQAGIAVHAAYIIGLPNDTPASVGENVQQLLDLGADQASFFMLGRVPGSEDWLRAKLAGWPMDEDLNRYDSFQPMMDHPQMTRQEWQQAFNDAWRQFYSIKNMIEILKRFPDRQKRLRLLANFLWYWWSVRVENSHPMVAGWWRFCCWGDRRPGVSLNRWRHSWRVAWQPIHYLRWLVTGFYVFQQVILETEFSPLIAGKKDLAKQGLNGFKDWKERTFGPAMSRQWLNAFWIKYGQQKWRLLHPWRSLIWHLGVFPRAISEVVYTARSIKLAAMMCRVMRSREV